MHDHDDPKAHAPGDQPGELTPAAELGRELADAVVAALPGWAEAAAGRAVAATGAAMAPALRRAVRAAGDAAAADVEPALRDLLGADIDEQLTTPLTLVRRVARHVTDVLLAAGVPAPARDAFVAERFPDDPYDLGPVGWADLGPAVHEAGIRWGAAKAAAHKARHDPGGASGAIMRR